MGLPSAPVRPENRQRVGCCWRSSQGRDVSGQPGRPRDRFPLVPQLARDVWGVRGPFKTTKSTRSGEGARTQWEAATASSSPTSSLLATIPRCPRAGRTPGPARLCFALSELHFPRKQILCFRLFAALGPRICQAGSCPGHLGATTSETPSGAQISPALQGTPCLGFPGKST